MTCDHQICRRRAAALNQLVDLLQPDRDQRRAFEALDAALASAEAALVEGPDTRPCATCGVATPVDEFPPFGRGTSKSCVECVSARAKRVHAKAQRLTEPTGRPVVVHGPRFPSNGGR